VRFWQGQQNEIHSHIVRRQAFRHWRPPSARLLGLWHAEQWRTAFRLHRVFKLKVRRSQHFQQIRHPARSMILDQTLKLNDLIQSAIWHEPCLSQE
jgi:hypothetical protein